MTSYERFIRPSSKIETPSLQLKAEIATWLVLGRLIVISGLFVILLTVHFINPGSMIGAIVLNIIAYGLVRTRAYQFATLLIIIEPLILIPTTVVTPNNTSLMILSGPIWLSLGPLIASFVLPTRHTAAVIAATCLSFVIVFLHARPEFNGVITAEIATMLGISCLALLGSSMRDRADRDLEIERAKVMQSSKLASLGEMASGIAHELNTPLGAIMLNSEMASEGLNESNSTSDARQNLHEIIQIAERMSIIISGLKNFSRDSEHELIQPLGIATCIEDALQLCQKRFAANAIQLTSQIDSSALAALPVRRVQISQAILNLLVNAFDAVKDRPEKWVRIDARITESVLELSVTDSGLGISKKLQERLFEPFYTTKEFGQGTGLGLSISRGIIQTHQGDLLFDTTSTNTRFIIRLPTASVAQLPTKAAA